WYDRRDASIRAWNRVLLASATDSQSEPERCLIAAKGLPFRVRMTVPSLARLAASGRVRFVFSRGTTFIAQSPHHRCSEYCAPCVRLRSQLLSLRIGPRHRIHESLLRVTPKAQADYRQAICGASSA